MCPFSAAYMFLRWYASRASSPKLYPGAGGRLHSRLLVRLRQCLLAGRAARLAAACSGATLCPIMRAALGRAWMQPRLFQARARSSAPPSRRAPPLTSLTAAPGSPRWFARSARSDSPCGGRPQRPPPTPQKSMQGTRVGLLMSCLVDRAAALAALARTIAPRATRQSEVNFIAT